MAEPRPPETPLPERGPTQDAEILALRQVLSLLRTPSIMQVELGTFVEKEMIILFSDIRDISPSACSCCWSTG